MSDNKVKSENHQRFVAFSFAASDLLLEIADENNVSFVAGQVKTLTGCNENEISAKSWTEVFSDKDQETITALIKGTKKAGRSGPIMVNIPNKENGTNSKAVMMGISIPDNPHVFLALNATESFLDFFTAQNYKDTQLLDEKQFDFAALQAFQEAKKNGKNLDMTFIEASNLEKYKESMSYEDANNFNDNLNSLLNDESYNGSTASQLSKDRYCLIHGEEITAQEIENKIQKLLERTNEKTKSSVNDIGLKRKTVEADMAVLSEREARRAMVYTINQIEKGGLDAASDSLSKSFDDYLQENADKITRLKTLVGKQEFQVHFQPIVGLPDEEVYHYEALVRFSTEDSPYDLIVFGEDVGIASDIDMAILKQSIGYIQKNQKRYPDLCIAVNISGQSIQSESFFSKMIEHLVETKCDSKHLMFEITESTTIGDLEKANKHVQELRKKGHKICLDDFGAGATSFQYLNNFDIDYVKIDGKYVRDAILSKRDEAMVRNLVRMCEDLGIKTIAEMVENQEQLDYLNNIGVDFAQGWLFGKPSAKAEYNKRKT